MGDLQDHEIKESIPVDYGVGIEYEFDGVKYRTTKEKKEGSLVKLEVSSWVGISAGARHVYGHMVLPYLSAKCLASSSKFHKVGSVYGGSCVWKLDLITKIHVTRPITKADKKLDDGDAFYAYEIGEPTDRFDTEAWLHDKAKREFKRIFAKGWSLYIERMRQINKKGEPEFWETYKEILVKPDER